jgi:hypothetical protein
MANLKLMIQLIARCRDKAPQVSTTVALWLGPNGANRQWRHRRRVSEESLSCHHHYTTVCQSEVVTQVACDD